MSDRNIIEAELEKLNDEMKEWEEMMAYDWSNEDFCKYYEAKRCTLKTFFLDQVRITEEKVACPTPEKEACTSASEKEACVQEAQIEQDDACSKAEAEARAQVEAEVKAEAEAEAEARAQIEAEVKAEAEAEAEAKAKAEAEAEAEAKAKAMAEVEAATKVQAEEEADNAAKVKAEAEAAAAAAAAEAKANATVEAEVPPSPVASLAVSAPAAPSSPSLNLSTPDDLEDLNAALEKELKEAQLRITQKPFGRQANLTDPAVITSYIQIRNPNDSLSWMILGYPNPDQQNWITVLSSGDGSFDEMVSFLPEEPVFMYIDFKFGDTSRSKMIFLTYVPDSLGGMKKSRVLGHRPAVEKLLKYMQMSWHVLDKKELQVGTLNKKLLDAGGANYSVQESNKGDFSGYKTKTATFYNEVEKTGNLGSIVFQEGALSTTPMDISGRSMVAAQSEFRGNLKDLK